MCIETSTIIGSLLTAMTDADLTYFNQAPVPAPFAPQTVPQVLEAARSTKASGGTAPAAGLWEAYAEKKVY